MNMVNLETCSCTTIEKMIELKSKIESISGKNISFRAFGDCFEAIRIGEFINDKTDTVEELLKTMDREKNIGITLSEVVEQAGYFINFDLTIEEIEKNKELLNTIMYDLDFFLEVFEDNK